MSALVGFLVDQGQQLVHIDAVNGAGLLHGLAAGGGVWGATSRISPMMVSLVISIMINYLHVEIAAHSIPQPCRRFNKNFQKSKNCLFNRGRGISFSLSSDMPLSAPGRPGGCGGSCRWTRSSSGAHSPGTQSPFRALPAGYAPAWPFRRRPHRHRREP